MFILRLASIALLFNLSEAFAQQWQAELRPDRGTERLRPRVAVIKDPESKLEIRDGVFVFDSRTKGGVYLGVGTNPPYGEDLPVLGDASAWDGRAPTTVEARLRVVRMAADAGIAAQLNVANGQHNWLLNVAPGGLPGLAFDATQFHTYRVTLKQGVPNLYVDGKLAPEASLHRYTYARNALLIGDISSSAGGVSEWEYIRWTNREATPWEVSDERRRLLEKELVVVGDRRGDVQEVNITPPLGPPARLADGGILSWFPISKKILCDAESERVVEDLSFVQKARARFSRNNGRTWTPPQTLFEFPREPGARSEGAILVSRSGAVHLWGLNFFKCPLKFPFDYSQFHSDLWHARSPDGGKTWPLIQKVDFGYAYTGASNSAIQLKSGRILVPISRYSDRPTGRFVTCVPYSDDDGLTWYRPVDEVVIDTGGAGLESGACEPVAIELKDRRVWMLIRAQDGYQWESFSSDGGLHWSPPRHSRFVCTNSPVAMLRLRDGRIVVLWNNCGSDNLYNRLLLTAALTPDEGKTWYGYREIARMAENGTLAYPYVTETRDGKVLMVMLQGQRMIRFDPAFLMRTSFCEEFADGLGRWSQLGTDGAEPLTDLSGRRGRVLRLRKPKADVPAGVCLNFPFGVAGEMTVQLQVEPGFQGAHVALSDHYDMPGLAKDGAFALQVEADGKLAVRQADGKLASTEAALKPEAWHDLRVVWNCVARTATLFLDGKRVAIAPLLGEQLGVCYLRLRSMAEKTDEKGFQVRLVAVQSQPVGQ